MKFIRVFFGVPALILIWVGGSLWFGVLLIFFALGYIATQVWAALLFGWVKGEEHLKGFLDRIESIKGRLSR